jgi:hypothetical protein
VRIYLSCLQSRRRHSIPAYGFWEPYFKRGIEESGHAWVECAGVDWVEGLTYSSPADVRAWRERTWNAVLEDVRRRHSREGVDLFLGYFYPKQIDPDAVREIQSLGIPCVNFFCDNVREFRAVPEEYHAFTLHWVPERAALPMYRRARLSVVHRAMPVWVDPALRTSEHEERHPPTFVGSRDALREALFARVLALGANIELRGPGWLPGTTPPFVRREFTWRQRMINQRDVVRRFGAVALLWKAAERLRQPIPDRVFTAHARPPVFGDAYTEVTQQSRITIGVNRYPSVRRPHFLPDTYSRLRDLEAPMMGACYLTEWTPELEDMYDIGEEIETFRSPEELVEKVRMLEGDGARRQQLRRAGQRRALAEHTVGRTIDAIGNALGVPA